MQRFKTHEESVIAFTENKGEAWDPSTKKQPQVSAQLNSKMKCSAAYHARLMKWLDASSNLSTPWPEEHTRNILHKRNGAYPEIFGWCKEENLFFLESVLGMGVSPVLFVSSAYSTLLGFAAYTENVEAVSLLLQYCAPPASRLLLTEKHVSKNDPALNSTLLHRLCSKYKYSNSLQVLKIVDSILEHDPDAILAQTQGGDTVYKNTTSDLKSHLKQRYDERMSYLQAQRIENHLTGTGVVPPNRRKI